jgi:cytoskeletal protein CcmA (bactofilin family)
MGKWLGRSKENSGGKPDGSGKPDGAQDYIRCLDKGDKLEGTLELTQAFRIESEVKGTVRCSNRLIVGENARVKGNIEGTIVSVAGKIKGTVKATDYVEILSTGVIKGEVYTPSLVVEEGGVFKGRCQLRPEAKPIKVAEPLPKGTGSVLSPSFAGSSRTSQPH